MKIRLVVYVLKNDSEIFKNNLYKQRQFCEISLQFVCWFVGT